jgi:hypothetical protein
MTAARPRRGRVPVDERGAEGRHGRTGRDALQQTGGRERDHVLREEEQYERDRLERDRGAQHRAAADVVGQGADDEQRAEQADHVDGELRIWAPGPAAAPRGCVPRCTEPSRSCWSRRRATL